MKEITINAQVKIRYQNASNDTRIGAQKEQRMRRSRVRPPDIATRSVSGNSDTSLKTQKTQNRNILPGLNGMVAMRAMGTRIYD
jgi:hypothetical protein